MFKLTADEAESLRSQFVISNSRRGGRGFEKYSTAPIRGNAAATAANGTIAEKREEDGVWKGFRKERDAIVERAGPGERLKNKFLRMVGLKIPNTF